MKKDFSNFDNVDKYIKNKHIYSELREFGYREVNGFACFLGWEIILFYEDRVNLSAITLTFNSEHEIIVTESYTILEIIGFDVKNFNVSSIMQIFNFIGKEASIRGGQDFYLALNDSLLILNESDGRINELDCIINPKIITVMLGRSSQDLQPSNHCKNQKNISTNI